MPRGIVVIGKERSNWREGHGSACTCADCSTQAEQRRFDIVTQGRKGWAQRKGASGNGKKYKKCHGGLAISQQRLPDYL